MSKSRPAFIPLLFLLSSAAALFLSSCGVQVKNFRKDRPFVYQTNINVKGNFSRDSLDLLRSRLKSQLDDSMRSRSVSKVFFSVMKSPPVYDTSSAEKSVLYMRALLNSLGYFHDTITYKARIDTLNNGQMRTTVDFTVAPGKVVRIDSFAYNLRDSNLQRLASTSQAEAVIKEGDPFAKSNISLELDRLVQYYRERGYMKFGRDDLYGLWDTLDISLLNPTADPFEQLLLLQKIKERRENPKANLEIRLRPITDSNKLKQFYVGNVTIYPDYINDTLNRKRTETVVNDVRVVSYQNKFRPKIFPPNIYLVRGELYDQRKYFRTINRFNSIGAWKLTNIEPSVREGTDTADFVIRLNAAKKYSATANLEGSRNQTPFSGNLFGLAVNLGLQNRNFAKSANQAMTNLRYGIETGRDTATDVKFVQTQQFSASHIITFPKGVLIGRLFGPETRNNIKTSLSVNGSITKRRELYDLNTLNGSWGYDIFFKKWRISGRWPNIEYSSLTAKEKLLEIFKNNPSLKRVFNDGLIASVIGNASTTGGKGNQVNLLKIGGELSGFPGIIRNDFFDTNLYRFVKLDVEAVKKISFRKSAVVFRLFAGVGYEFTSTVNPNNKYNLPFFRQYFAGGPNSMRAWGLRKLGPGSLVRDFGTTGQPDRYGDMQLEGNIEYRFPLTTVAGVKINGALFTDIGNIWYVKKPPGEPDESVFRFQNLGRDLAVGAGIGFRIDFNFFVVRLDASHKVKDPSPSPSYDFLKNKWFGYVDKNFLFGSRFQLGISYPFIL